jgi:hypothetical protein
MTPWNAVWNSRVDSEQGIMMATTRHGESSFYELEDTLSKSKGTVSQSSISKIRSESLRSKG